jgi:putative thioredoxin
VTSSPHILDVNEADFEAEVLLRSHDLPVVVDFWAAWCGPCRTLGPLLERLALEAAGRFRLAKIDVDANPNLAARFGVQGIPAVKAFVGGEVRAEFVGAQPEAMVRNFIERVAPSERDRALEQARSLLATRHWAEAAQAFQAIRAQDENSGPAALGLVQALLMLGRGEEALALLDGFPRANEALAAARLRPLAVLLALNEAETSQAADDPLEAGYRQAGRLIQRGNLPAAMDGLLEVLRQDKRYRGGEVKDVLLALFSLLGDEDPLTRQYRDELASVLF